MKERRWCSGGGCVWSNTKWKSCGRMPIQVLQSQWRSITPLGKFTNVEEMWEGHTLITWKNLPKTNLFLQQSLKTQGTIPLVKSAKCKCARHKPGCRCLSDSYLKGPRISHFSCLNVWSRWSMQGALEHSPNTIAEMCINGKTGFVDSTKT